MRVPRSLQEGEREREGEEDEGRGGRAAVALDEGDPHGDDERLVQNSVHEHAPLGGEAPP